MSNRQNDRIGKVAGYVLVAVIIAVLLGGAGLMQAQDAIDASVAEQQQMACFQHARMCAAVERAK